MSQTNIGVLLVIICALLEGVGQVFFKKSVVRAVRWHLWISCGVLILALEAALYTKALLFLDVGAAYAVSSLSLISVRPTTGSKRRVAPRMRSQRLENLSERQQAKHHTLPVGIVVLPVKPARAQRQ